MTRLVRVGRLSLAAMLLTAVCPLLISGQAPIPPKLNSPPSQIQIAGWLSELEATREVPEPSFSANWTNDKFAVQNRRHAAFESLLSSKEGLRALVVYWLSHSKEQVTPHMAECLSTCCVYLDLALHEKTSRLGSSTGLDILSEEQWRAFLLSLELEPRRWPGGFPGRFQTDSMPVQLTTNLQQVWMSWLMASRTDGLSVEARKLGPTQDSIFFFGATQALWQACDPAGLGRTLAMLQDADLGVLPGPAGEYLRAMGEAEGFEPLNRLLSKEACGSGALSVLALADEDSAKQLYDRFQWPTYAGYKGTSFPPGREGRPDLLRGLALPFLSDPALREMWERACEENPSNPNWYIEIPRRAVPVLRADKILEEALHAERSNRPRLLALWIDALGRKNSTAGTSDLMRWATSVEGLSANPGARQLVSEAAGTALLRRAVGSERESLLTELRSLAATERSKVAEQMLRCGGILPRPGPALLEGMSADEQVQRKAEGWDSASFCKMIRFNQGALLPLMSLVDGQERMVGTYALMTCQRGLDRFSELLRSGDRTAVSLAWRYSLPVSADSLKRALSKPSLSLGDQILLRLRLSELGDSQTFDVLKKDLSSSLRNPAQPLRPWYLSIWEEMARRRDATGLLQSDILLAKSVDPPGTTPGMSGKSLIVIREGLLACLLRIAPEAALARLAGFIPTREEDRRVLLHISSNANSANAERVLRRLSTLTSDWKNSTAEERQKREVLILWGPALQKTGTKWCRDQLFLMGQWDALAELGDPRSAQIEVGSGPYQLNGDLIRDSLLGDDVPKAISILLSNYGRSHTNVWIAPYVSIPGRRLPEMRTYPQERFAAVRKSYMLALSKLSPWDRVQALTLLGSEDGWWSDQMLRTLLQDACGPVRLSILLYLLEHPRTSLREDALRMEKSDPYPWCRRVAKEIRLFELDPLHPEEGIRFIVPKYP